MAGLFLMNFLASVLHARFDLTQEKRYSLTPTTKDLLRNLQSDVVIDVFLKGDFEKCILFWISSWIFF